MTSSAKTNRANKDALIKQVMPEGTTAAITTGPIRPPAQTPLTAGVRA